MWKAVIAIFACAYFLRERSARSRSRRLRAMHVAFAVLAFGAYFHFGDLPYKGFFHRWETFHYYLGAKYSSELGYANLYRCVSVADAETGARESVMRRTMRDLETDALVPAATSLDRPEACTARFSAARWSEFRHDVVWFRETAGDGAWWEAMQNDHGYNAPPAFTLLARPLTELAPLGEASILALASLDLLLMTAIVLLLGWAFGARTAALGVVFWGTQAASEFYWTGGAFLRQDWLFFSVLSLCLLRKNRPAWAGAALAAAASLRVFPLLFFAGPLVVVAAAWLRRRALNPSYSRFLFGGALALCLLAGTSAIVAGPENLRDFATRVELRATSQIANHMGFRTLFSASPATRMERTADERLLDPSAPWAAARTERFDALFPAYALAVLAFTALWVRAVSRLKTPWIAVALGAALVPLLTEPASYYYSFVLLAVPLARALPSLEVALVGLAGAGQLIALRFPWADDRFTGLALVYVAFALASIAAFSRKFASAPRLFAPKRSSLLRRTS
ncbi:MAG TPA: hypothetical protein VF103_16920 [Polyangiaceae bacterium]